MKRISLLLFFITGTLASSYSQSPDIVSGNMTKAAIKFLQLLSIEQKEKTQFTFDNEERYNWHFVPISRKGIPLKELTAAQRKAGFDLLHTVLSDTGFNKVTSIMGLENILKEVENRPVNDHYRDPENYYFSIFGNPVDSIWGWRFEGHHL